MTDRELDALVAERVMERKFCHCSVWHEPHTHRTIEWQVDMGGESRSFPSESWTTITHFSSTGDGMLEVIDRLGEQGLRVEVTVDPQKSPAPDARARACVTRYSDRMEWHAYAATAPSAVCLAALRVVDADPRECRPKDVPA